MVSGIYPPNTQGKNLTDLIGEYLGDPRANAVLKQSVAINDTAGVLKKKSEASDNAHKAKFKAEEDQIKAEYAQQQADSKKNDGNCVEKVFGWIGRIVAVVAAVAIAVVSCGTMAALAMAALAVVVLDMASAIAQEVSGGKVKPFDLATGFSLGISKFLTNVCNVPEDKANMVGAILGEVFTVAIEIGCTWGASAGQAVCRIGKVAEKAGNKAAKGADAAGDVAQSVQSVQDVFKKGFEACAKILADVKTPKGKAFQEMCAALGSGKNDLFDQAVQLAANRIKKGVEPHRAFRDAFMEILQKGAKDFLVGHPDQAANVGKLLDAVNGPSGAVRTVSRLQTLSSAVNVAASAGSGASGIVGAMNIQETGSAIKRVMEAIARVERMDDYCDSLLKELKKELKRLKAMVKVLQEVVLEGNNLDTKVASALGQPII